MTTQTQSTTTTQQPLPLDGGAGGGAGTQASGAQGASGNTSPGGTQGGGTQGAGATGAQQGSQGQGTTQAAAPQELELKLPEGFKDEAWVGEFKPLAKELGLKSDTAQKVLELHAKGLSALQASQQSAVEAQHKAWIEAAKTDKEYGGAALDKNIETARKAVLKFGGEGLSKFLSESGLGNHPEVIRAFFRVGKTISEDSVAGSAGASGSGAGPMTDAERRAVMFPTMAKEILNTP